MLKRKLAGVFAIAVALVLVGTIACSNTQTLALLNAVVDTVEASFPAIAAAAHLSPAVTSDISEYLAAVADGVQKSTVILQSSATTAEKATQIAAALAGIAQPILPAGSPQTIVAVLVAVNNAVQNFLKVIAAGAPSPSGARTAARSLPRVMHMSGADKRVLAVMGVRASLAKQHALAMKY